MDCCDYSNRRRLRQLWVWKADNIVQSYSSHSSTLMLPPLLNQVESKSPLYTVQNVSLLLVKLLIWFRLLLKHVLFINSLPRWDATTVLHVSNPILQHEQSLLASHSDLKNSSTVSLNSWKSLISGQKINCRQVSSLWKIE